MLDPVPLVSPSVGGAPGALENSVGAVCTPESSPSDPERQHVISVLVPSSLSCICLTAFTTSPVILGCFGWSIGE